MSRREKAGQHAAHRRRRRRCRRCRRRRSSHRLFLVRLLVQASGDDHSAPTPLAAARRQPNASKRARARPRSRFNRRRPSLAGRASGRPQQRRPTRRRSAARLSPSPPLSSPPPLSPPPIVALQCDLAIRRRSLSPRLAVTRRFAYATAQQTRSLMLRHEQLKRFGARNERDNRHRSFCAFHAS